MTKLQSDISSLEIQLSIMNSKLQELSNRPEFSQSLVIETYYSLEANIKVCSDLLSSLKKFTEIIYFL